MIRHQRGFTLIELIVVFMVIAILSVIGVAAFVSYGRIQTLESASSALTSALLLAKSRALSQVKPSECTDKILSGYQVYLNIPSNSYELDAVCSRFTYRIPPPTRTLPKNISFDPIKTTSTLFFFPVISSGVVISNGAQNTGTIVLTGYGNTKTITVDSIGGIK